MDLLLWNSENKTAIEFAAEEEFDNFFDLIHSKFPDRIELAKKIMAENISVSKKFEDMKEYFTSDDVIPKCQQDIFALMKEHYPCTRVFEIMGISTMIFSYKHSAQN